MINKCIDKHTALLIDKWIGRSCTILYRYSIVENRGRYTHIQKLETNRYALRRVPRKWITNIPILIMNISIKQYGTVECLVIYDFNEILCKPASTH